MSLQRRAEGLEGRRQDREARGGAVAAIALQVLRASVQRTQQVEPGNAPARALGASRARQRHEYRRPVVALDDPRGHDPDHPGVPALGSQHVGVALPQLGHLGLGLPGRPFFDGPALGVQPVELAGDLLGPIRVRAEQQLDTRVGPGQPARGVDSRSQPKAEAARVEVAGIATRHGHQGPQARLLGVSQRPQAGSDQTPVLATERDQVGHRGQRHQVQVRFGAGRAERGGQLVGHAGAAQVRAGIAADLGMDDRAAGQLPVGPGPMVVGHDHLQAGPPGLGHLLHGGDPAVDGDH